MKIMRDADGFAPGSAWNDRGQSNPGVGNRPTPNPERETEMNDYNPFPQVTDVVPYWHNSGVCYSRAAYTDQETAELVAAHVRSQGGTVNGGLLHGMPLGGLQHMPARPAKPYSEIYPEGSPMYDPNRFTEAVPETWEVTY